MLHSSEEQALPSQSTSKIITETPSIEVIVDGAATSGAQAAASESAQSSNRRQSVEPLSNKQRNNFMDEPN